MALPFHTRHAPGMNCCTHSLLRYGFASAWLCACLSACSAADMSSEGVADTFRPVDVAEPAAPKPEAADDAHDQAGGDAPVQVQSGILTAGVWDDNLNFDLFKHYRETLLAQNLPGTLEFDMSEHAAAHEQLSNATNQREKLDITLVIDTTGSMSDEISFLQQEFTAISEQIQERFPNSEQRWALIVYRDEGDAYVTRVTPFTSKVNDFRSALLAQSANGGGDFPEAPDVALQELTELEWRDGDDVAKLAFWVADAPHHPEDGKRMAKSLRNVQRQGIHLYPVASSGIDEHTELTMRSAAQLTGGRYLFLTDDSGVGAAHKQASVPCYYVTRLDDAFLRMVDVELSGNYRAPSADELLRTVGDPVEGKCALGSQTSLSEAVAF